MSMGSLGINTVMTFTTLFFVQVISLIATWPDFPVLTLVGIATGWALVFPALFFPIAKTLWLSIDLMMRPLEEEELSDDRPPRRA